MSKLSNGAEVEVSDDRDGRPRRSFGDPLGNNSEIGRKLKQYFDDVVSEGVPDRFSMLLSQLERSDGPHGPSQATE